MSKKVKKRYNELTINEIRKAYKFQKENCDWTFYSEKEFLETLFSNKFSNLLLTNSIFIAAFAMMNDQISKIKNIILFFVIVIILTATNIWTKT